MNDKDYYLDKGVSSLGLTLALFALWIDSIDKGKYLIAIIFNVPLGFMLLLTMVYLILNRKYRVIHKESQGKITIPNKNKS